MPHFGKYMGYIRDVSDPDNRCRIRCYCPEIMGPVDAPDHWLDWALPCLPWMATRGVGLNFVPELVSGDAWAAWIEFRHGDARFPIWAGLFPINPVDTTTTEIVADTVNLGPTPDQIQPLTDGLVHGLAIDTFTGLPLWQLGGTTQHVFAKKP